MRVKTVVVGMLATNCYLLADEEKKICAVIDPGARTERILEALAAEGWKAEYILLTHGHYDHVLAAPKVQAETGARLYISRKDEWMLVPAEARHPGYIREEYVQPRVDGFLEEGTPILLGGLKIDVLATPGHTAGSVTLLCGDQMFSGDTLFLESCGRTDLESGSMDDMLRSLKKLAELPGDYHVCPGHEEDTTLAHERATNPYMQEGLRQ